MAEEKGGANESHMENSIDSKMHGDVVTIVYANETRFGLRFKCRQVRAYTGRGNIEGLSPGLVIPVRHGVAGQEWAEQRILELQQAADRGELVLERIVHEDEEEDQ